MSHNIILIGQAPGKTGDPSRPLIGGKVGTKIQAMCGMTLKQYVKSFHRFNVFKYWMGNSGDGDAFPMPLAKVLAALLVQDLKGETVVFVGVKTAAAFGVRAKPLTWTPFNAGRAAILPHPSGLNRWYNKPENREAASRFMRSLSI